MKVILLVISSTCFLLDGFGITGIQNKKVWRLALTPLGLAVWVVYELVKLLGG